jgi:hypothetical protein
LPAPYPVLTIAHIAGKQKECQDIIPFSASERFWRASYGFNAQRVGLSSALANPHFFIFTMACLTRAQSIAATSGDSVPERQSSATCSAICSAVDRSHFLMA